MMESFVTVAPNGARRSSADHRHTPITPQQIADCAEACRDAGAAMIHMHVRDTFGRHILDSRHYREAIELVENRLGDTIIIQISTESAGIYEPAQQMQCVRDVRPESASVSIRELCPSKEYEGAYFEFLHECADNGVFVQHIFYTSAEIRKFVRYQKRGSLPKGPFLALAVIGDHRGSHATPSDALLAMSLAAEEIEDSIWTACAFGAGESNALETAIDIGWHIRTGFENTLHLSNGQIAPDNAALVHQYVDQLHLLDYHVLDAIEVRKKILRQP